MARARIYDFLIGNELTFEVPDQSLDLYALGGRKRHVGGFAADLDAMEPASCCFGPGEQSWRPLTLYILMRSGDIYALSPIVPSRWDAPQGYIQKLSLEITAEQSFDGETTPEAKATNRHQTKWINEVLNQRQRIVDAQTSFATPKGIAPTCLTRPTVVGPTPILQGPFLFQPAPPESMGDDIPAACDIFHLEAGSIGVVGIIYSNGKLDICLEEEPITAKWMSKNGKKSPEAPSLPMISHYETINFPLNAGEGSEYTSWPNFTRDPLSAQMLFVNSIAGVILFSMKGWLSRLEAVLDDQEDEDFLVKTLQKAPRTQVQAICSTPGNPVEGCTVLYEAYIGYIIIAKLPNGLSSKAFDEPISIAPFDDTGDTITLQPASRRFTNYANTSFGSACFTSSEVSMSMSTKSQPQKKPTPPIPTPTPLNILQPPYKPSPEFTKPSALPGFIRSLSRDAKKPILFSADTLRTLETARDTLSIEFSALMTGAQEMYDRAAAQRLEYSKQLEALHSIHARLATIKSRNVSERLETFIACQDEMQKRAEALLKRLITEGELGLSDAEKKWAKEVKRMEERVAGSDGQALGGRTIRVNGMMDELVAAAREVVDKNEEHDPVPAEVREGKLGMLKGLLEREYVSIPFRAPLTATDCLYVGVCWSNRPGRGWRRSWWSVIGCDPVGQLVCVGRVVALIS